MDTFLHSFRNLLENAGTLPETPEEIPGALGAAASRLRDFFVEEGDRAYAALEKEKPEEPGEVIALFLHFQLAERVKQLIILYRDVLFQHLKGRALAADGKLGHDALARHGEASRQTLLQASEELGQWMDLQLETHRSDDPGARRQRSRWRVQNNPWPVYREQLETICSQFDFLRKNAETAGDAIDSFHKIANLIRQTLVHCMEEIRLLITQAGDTQQWLEATEDKPSRIATRLEEVNEGLLLPHHPEAFGRDLQALSTQLPDKWQVAIDTEGGMVQRIDIDLQRRTNQWLEREVLPLLYEVWELTESAHNDLKLSLSNIRNRVLLLTEGKEIFQASQFVQPLLRSQMALGEFLVQCGELESLLEERLQAHFYLSHIYRTTQPFLPLSVQTTMRQLGVSQSRTLQRVLSWLSGRLTALQHLWRTVEREEQLGFAEKTARYLEARQPDPSNSHYVPIFLTQGFVGASFAVGREVEMQHMENLVRQWQSGFRGAAIITGRRFAGKTFFGEWAASRFFSGQLIRLSPSQSTLVKGRKLPATCKLEAVLDFLKKYALDTRPLIWIDDLELWQDKEHTLYDNARALIRFNDHYATRCFVLVSVNQWTHRLLQRQLGLDRAFQAVFEMGDLTKEEVIQAILIRHGATHKKLVQADGQELSPRQVTSLISQVRRAAGGNIGETLQWWTAAIRTRDEDSVRSLFFDHFSLPELPRLPDPDTALVLREILLQRKADEYRLRKQFGPAFQDRYAHLVRRLLSLGLLDRLPDGSLQVRETAANAVADQLEISMP